MTSIDPTPAGTIAALEERYANLPSGGINEANTRLQFINDMLTGVLGWPIEHLDPEEYLRGLEQGKKKWIDYHVKHGDAIRLVVEAKRTGATFSLPSSKKRRPIRLAQLRANHGEPLKQAIDQALRYCIDVGTYAFVVTNGVQWIASLAFAHTIVYDREVHDTLMFFQNDRNRDWRNRWEEKARAFLIYLARREGEELTRMGAPQARLPWLAPVAETIGVEFFGRDFRKDARGSPHRRSP